MFTGLIQEVATIDSVLPQAGVDSVREIRVRSDFRDVVEGESIAVNGVCLTVTAVRADGFSVQAIGSTLSRTTIGEWVAGRRVNLERALKMSDQLGGHMVQGHVDMVGEVVSKREKSNMTLLDVNADAAFNHLLVLHGSVTVDGVSLTVNQLSGESGFQVALIPFTLEHTTLGALSSGSRVHLEGDVIGKYVQRAMEPYLTRMRAHTAGDVTVAG